MWLIWPQSGLQPANLRFTTPWNDGRRIGSLVRSIGTSAMTSTPLGLIRPTANKAPPRQPITQPSDGAVITLWG
jgi:hypothetical protein